MAGRPRNSVDLELAAKANVARKTKRMSVRALAAATGEPKSVVHRFLCKGVIPGSDMRRAERLLAAIESGGKLETGKSRKNDRNELSGQIWALSRKLTKLLSELDEIVRNHG